MTKLERVQALDDDILRSFMQTHRSQSIPEELQRYILQLSSTSSIIHFEGTSAGRVTRALRKEYPELSYSQALNIYYDALNFFYIDDNVTAAAWDNYYAEKMEDLSRLAIKAGNLSVAQKCMAAAHDLRTKNRDIINPADWAPPVFLISPKLTPEQLGFKKQDLFEIARRQEDKTLGELIEKLPTSEKEKKRLMKEAAIEDAVIISDDDDTAE